MIIIIIFVPSGVPWNQDSSYPTDEQLIAVKTSNDSSKSLETSVMFVCVFQLNTNLQVFFKIFLLFTLVFCHDLTFWKVFAQPQHPGKSNLL